MNKLIPLVAFSVLLLVPVGAQQVFGDHNDITSCPIPETGSIFVNFLSYDGPSGPFIDHNGLEVCQLVTGPPCNAPYVEVFDGLSSLCVRFLANSIPPYPFICQDGAVLDGNNHCVPDLNQICSTGTIPSGLQCIAQSMNSLIGGELLNINSISLLAAAIGTNQIITALVGITLAGVAGQAAWFIHKKKKNDS